MKKQIVVPNTSSRARSFSNFPLGKKTIGMYVLVLAIAGMLSSIAHAQTSDSTAVTLSLVNQDPDPAVSGDTFEVRLGIENRGRVAAENIVVEIVPEYPFTMVAGESNAQNVGTIKAYQTGSNMKILKFKLRVDKDATAGRYALKVREYEKGKEAVSGVQSISIDVQSKESAEVIYIDKTILVPGKEDSLKFTINNVGGAPLRDLTFSWINGDKIILPVGSDNTKYIKYIDIGDSVELNYQVIADSNAEAGLYELNLQLTYYDPISGGEKEISTIAGIYVGGGTDFDIAFSESSAGQTSFTIANIGSNPAFSVSVIVPQQQGWRVTGSNSMIIGNLNKGDYTVASFGLQPMQAQQRNISQQQSLTQRSMQTPLKIQIAYTDTSGKRELVEKEVSINTEAVMSLNSDQTDSQATASQTAMASFRGRRQQGFFSKYKWYILVLVVLVIVGVGYWKYRKEKVLDQNFKIRDIFKIKNIFKKKSKAR